MKTWLSSTNPFSTVMRSQVFTVWMWRLKTLLDTTKPHFTFRSQVSEIFRFEWEWTGFKGHCINFWNIMVSIIYNTVRLKAFYWVITNNQAHIKNLNKKNSKENQFQYGRSLFTKLYAHLTPYIKFAYLNTWKIDFLFISVLSSFSLQLLYRMSIWRWSRSLAEIKK